MSLTENKRPKSTGDSGSRELPVGSPLYRRPIVLGAAVAVTAVLVVAGTLWAIHDDNDSSSTPVPSRAAPITLPGMLSGLAAAPDSADFAHQPLWRDRAKTAAGGAVVVGRSYGSPQVKRQIRVVAGRTDLTGKLEFAWAADAGRTVSSPFGAGHCTQNLILAARTAAKVRPTMMLCWRTTPGLSAYGVVINFEHSPTDADGMAALDATWKAALTGH